MFWHTHTSHTRGNFNLGLSRHEHLGHDFLSHLHVHRLIRHQIACEQVISMISSTNHMAGVSVIALEHNICKYLFGFDHSRSKKRSDSFYNFDVQFFNLIRIIFQICMFLLWFQYLQCISNNPFWCMNTNIREQYNYNYKEQNFWRIEKQLIIQKIN